MFFVSGKSPHKAIAEDVYEFFTDLYEIESDVEVYHTDLSNEYASGFTEVNGEEQFIQIHNKLEESEYVTTLLHELIHVVQNEQGLISDQVREDQAYHMEGILYHKWCASRQGVHQTPTDPRGCAIL